MLTESSNDPKTLVFLVLSLPVDVGPHFALAWSGGRIIMQAALTIEIQARNDLITQHLGMALKMARKMARRLPGTVSRDDVESAALLGLTEAASRYDTSRREPFMAFAAKRVRGAILDHLRKSDILSRRARQGARKVAEATRTAEAELGRPATDAEIAKTMGMTEMHFNQTYSRIREASVVHLEDLRTEIPDGSSTAYDIGERQRRKAALMAALELLDEREQMVLSCYYREGLNLREIGSILGVTESRVCQLHTQALLLLRAKLS